MQRRAMFGIQSACMRLVVWAIACVVSAVCMLVFWPLGVLPFVMLALFSTATTKERGRPWG